MPLEKNVVSITLGFLIVRIFEFQKKVLLSGTFMKSFLCRQKLRLPSATPHCFLFNYLHIWQSKHVLFLSVFSDYTATHSRVST